MKNPMLSPAWLCIPSARSIAECGDTLRAWNKRGYGIALWRDPGGRSEVLDSGLVQLCIERPYPGYAVAVNELAKVLFDGLKHVSWIITGGDDTLPDPDHAPDTIAAECEWYFRAVHAGLGAGHPTGPASWLSKRLLKEQRASTFGVMQPTGDRFAGGSIDRIAGSPWIGRSFAMRMNQGCGPYHTGFYHMFVDEYLKGIAEELGCYWMRPELVHLHNHFMRESSNINSDAVRRPVPAHLVTANSPEHWHESKALFERLKASRFTDCMPLALNQYDAAGV